MTFRNSGLPMGPPQGRAGAMHQSQFSAEYGAKGAERQDL
jgi:hypothetical protein